MAIQKLTPFNHLKNMWQKKPKKSLIFNIFVLPLWRF